MTRAGCGMLVSPKWCVVSAAACLARSCAHVSSNPTFPPAWFVEYSLLDYHFCISYRGHSRGRLTAYLLTRGATPFPARGLATASARVSLPSQAWCVPASDGKGGRIAPGKISREQHLDGAKWWHFARGHRTAVPLTPMVPLMGYTINLFQHTNTIQTHPETPAMPKIMHTHTLYIPTLMVIISPMALPRRQCHRRRRPVPHPASRLSSRGCPGLVLGPTWIEPSRRRPSGGWHPPSRVSGVL